MKTLIVRDYGFKLSSDVFVVVAPKKGPVDYDEIYTIKDPISDQICKAKIIGRINEYTMRDIPLVFTELSHQCQPSDLSLIYPGIDETTELSINIFKKVS